MMIELDSCYVVDCKLLKVVCRRNVTFHMQYILFTFVVVGGGVFLLLFVCLFV